METWNLASGMSGSMCFMCDAQGKQIAQIKEKPPCGPGFLGLPGGPDQSLIWAFMAKAHIAEAS